jgi:hypothetical protein
VSRATAIERVRDAQNDWDAAIRAHEEVMPELAPFAERLRATSQASAKQAAAFEYAAEAGLRSLAKDPVVRHPPRELSGKYRPPVGSETWQHFDDAISEWQEAWQSGETLTVARALRRLSTLTEMLADEVDELRRSSARTAGEGASAAERRAAGE